MNFKDLGLEDSLLSTIESSGFTEPTPIQASTIPLLLNGDDVIGQAQTGTGKTAAFALPILQKIDLDNPNVQALIVSPTRELAMQTKREMERLGAKKGVKVQVVFGGADIRGQIRNLKRKPQVIVGTPGRLLDHINRRTIRLDHVKFLVLDEADEMLDMGFLPDIKSIIKNVPEDRQTLLYSATMPDQIKKVGVQFMKDPKQITIKAKELTTDLVDQYYVRLSDRDKFNVMTRIFDVQKPKSTIIFCRTKRRVDEVSKGLVARGYRAAGLHGDLTQKRRSQIMNEFKHDKINYLVATDVAARGIDVSDVTHVINFDIPEDPESYVHRIGRTGRAGKHGTSISFIGQSQMNLLKAIERKTKVRMTPLKSPSAKEALNGQLETAEKDVDDLLAKTDTDKFADVANQLLEEHDATDLVAALLNDMTRDQVEVNITPERPNRRGGNRRNGYRGGFNKKRNGYRGKNGNGGRNRYPSNARKPRANKSYHSTKRDSSKSFVIKDN